MRGVVSERQRRGPWRRECLGLLERHLRQCCQVRRDRPGLQRLLDDAGHAALRVEHGDGGRVVDGVAVGRGARSEEHTSELQSLMRISYAVFCLKKKKITQQATYMCRTLTTNHI